MNDSDSGLTAEQEEFLRQQAAAHAATAPSPAGEAAGVAAQMGERGPLLPAEEQMDAMMAALKAQSEQIAALTAQIGTMQKQQAEALAASGGPMVTRYAEGARDKIAAHVTANPDAPAGHFDELTGAAGQLVDAAAAIAKDAAAGTGPVEKAAAAITRFVSRTHVRQWGKHIDWSAALDDVETVVEEALKLAA